MPGDILGRFGYFISGAKHSPLSSDVWGHHIVETWIIRINMFSVFILRVFSCVVFVALYSENYIQMKILLDAEQYNGRCIARVQQEKHVETIAMK